MNFDLGEVLTRAWQISWKCKVLWWFGGIMSIFSVLLLPVAFVPFSLPIFLKNGRSDLIPVLLIGFSAFLLLFLVILYFVSALTQTSIILGVVRAEEQQEISFRDLFKNSWPFFWRILGLMFLYAAVITVINLAIQALLFTVTIGTFGLGTMCATPLYLLINPFMFAAIVWMEQAMNGIIIDGMAVKVAIKQGWQLIRNNIMAIVLVMVVVYFGIGTISTIVIMPMMIPLFVIPFSFLEGEPNWTIISMSLLCSVAFAPLMALFSGWVMTFSKSAWVLTYLRLTRSPSAPQPALQQATV